MPSIRPRGLPSALPCAAALLLAGCVTPASLGPAEPGASAAFDIQSLGPATFRFTAFDADTGDLAAWDFGDGEGAEGRQVEHTYAGDGTFGVTLTVRGEGRSVSHLEVVKVGSGANRPPSAVLQLATQWVGQGGKVAASATGSSDPDGDAVTYSWASRFVGERAPEAQGHAHGTGAASPDKASYQPRDNGFDSPVLEPGQSYSRALQQPGLYFYHCHPHPWMTGSILVQAGAPTEARPLVMKDVQWFLPGHLTVGPGTNLAWTNQDPVWHTVTLLGFHAMNAPAPGEAKTEFRLDEEGVFEITLVVTDSKGAVNATTVPVLVTRLPPPTSYVRDFQGRIDVALPAGSANHTFEFPFPGDATFELSWSAPSPAAKARAEVFAGTQPRGEPVAVVEGERVQARLLAGAYVVLVTAEAAVALEYTVSLEATLEPRPDFGGGHGGH